MDELAHIREIFRNSLPTFNALGDSNRQQIILLLLEIKPKSVQELADRMQLSRPSISHHLKVLRDARLIEEQKEGTRTYYRLVAGGHIEELRELLVEIDRIEKLKKGNA